MHSIIEKQLKSWKKRIKTSDLNEWLGKVMTENPPPLKNGRAVKLKFASQVSVSPPKFNIFQIILVLLITNIKSIYPTSKKDSS